MIPRRRCNSDWPGVRISPLNWVGMTLAGYSFRTGGNKSVEISTFTLFLGLTFSEAIV